jgi:hypothetical protein
MRLATTGRACEQKRVVLDAEPGVHYQGVMNWDASIDIGSAHLEPGCPAPGEAVQRVRQAVERMPGAGSISVAWCGAVPAKGWLRVYPRGHYLEPEGPEWECVRRQVQRIVALALA